MIGIRKMQLSPRSYLTAGVAALGVSAVGLAPVHPLPEHATALPPRVVSGLSTTLLASSFDPITPWVDTITTSIDNIGALIGFALEKPFPIAQTIIANLGTYFGELTSGNAGLIPGQILGNIEKLFTAPWNPGETFALEIGPPASGNALVVTNPTNPQLSTFSFPAVPSPTGTPQNAFDLNLLLVQLVAGGTQTPPCSTEGICNDVNGTNIAALAQATTIASPYGPGVVLGLLGPVLSPIAAVINSVTAIVDFIGQSDVIGALNELVNIPANLVNGFLNGAVLDLEPIANLLAPGLFKGPIGLNLGGLITGPVPMNGSLDPADPPTEFSGGNLYTSLYADTLFGATAAGINAPGLPTGPIGSLIGMGQFLSEELLVTPPAAPAATEVAAAVEPDPAEEAPTLDGVEVTAAVAETAATARAGEKAAATSAAAPGAAESAAETGAATPAADTSAATTRAARKSAATAAAETRADGDSGRATHRGQRGAR